MKNRLHFAIVGGILIVAFILGSIFDRQLNDAVFQGADFGLGKFVSAVGLIPGYAVLAFLGGILLAIAIHQIDKKWLKAILIVAVIGCYGSAVYFSGKEFFSVNGYDKPGFGYLALGCGISAVIHGAVTYLGYLVGKKNENPKMWIVIAILLAAIFIALVPGTTLLKSIFHRPRYRLVIQGIDGITYHNWWERFADYKNYISDIITKEEFKSFPSGHASASMVLCLGLTFLPVFLPKLEKYQTLFFYVGFGYSILVSLTRILVGAHFLSDVAMGSILTILMFFIANEIIVRKKLLEKA